MTMRRIVHCFAAICMLAATSAKADFARVDPVPAATLLLPYFEVDLDDINGENTRFRIYNTDNLPTIAHVVLWTDWAIPTVGFEIFLEGFGSAELDMRSFFDGGPLPNPVPMFVVAQTQGGGGPPPCSGETLHFDLVAELNRAHVGAATGLFSDRCAAQAIGDRTARGFVTIDVVHFCTNDLPNDVDYFSEIGPAALDNHLAGTFAIFNRGSGSGGGGPLVPIEASGVSAGFSFYANFADSDGNDRREVLPLAMRSKFYDDETRQTDVIMWRDPGEATGARPCGMTPSWYPLEDGDFALIDADGNDFDVAEFVPFPAATNRVRVGSGDLPSPYDFGQVTALIDEAGPMAARTSGISLPKSPQIYLWTLHELGPNQAGGTAGIESFEVVF